MNHYQWVHGVAVNDVIVSDAVHPLVNCGQNTPIAVSILFNIEQVQNKVSPGPGAGAGHAIDVR